MSVLYKAQVFMRGLSAAMVALPPPIACNPGTSGLDCVCPGNCLTYNNATGGCHPNDCWKWNNVNNICEHDGKKFIPAMVLQAIPLTGVFGSGFGNMGRWDIFSYYMFYLFGGCLSLCCMQICCALSDLKKENDNPENDKSLCAVLLGQCGICLWAIGILVMYIWGIVVIANKDIDAPWTDWKGNSIFCPLVD